MRLQTRPLAFLGACSKLYTSATYAQKVRVRMHTPKECSKQQQKKTSCIDQPETSLSVTQRQKASLLMQFSHKLQRSEEPGKPLHVNGRYRLWQTAGIDSDTPACCLRTQREKPSKDWRLACKFGALHNNAMHMERDSQYRKRLSHSPSPLPPLLPHTPSLPTRTLPPPSPPPP